MLCSVVKEENKKKSFQQKQEYVLSNNICAMLHKRRSVKQHFSLCYIKGALLNNIFAMLHKRRSVKQHVKGVLLNNIFAVLNIKGVLLNNIFIMLR